jgi:hypothetical protein
LEALRPNPNGKCFAGYGETHQWTFRDLEQRNWQVGVTIQEEFSV